MLLKHGLSISTKIREITGLIRSNTGMTGIELKPMIIQFDCNNKIIFSELKEKIQHCGMALLLVFQSVVVPPFLGWADKTGIQFLQMQFLLKKAMMMDEAEVSQSLSKTFFG